MAKELVKKNVDGSDYEFQIFGAKQSLKLLTRLSRMILEPMGAAAGSLEGEGPMIERVFGGKGLAMAAKALSDKLDQDEVLNLVETFCSYPACLCDGKQFDFNTHYEGRLGHLFKVLKAALEVQYGDFFADISAPRASKVQATTQVELT